jgi:type IV secretion system protein VirB9
VKPVATALLFVAAAAWAETTPAPGAGDPRVRSVAYQPEEVVRLQGQVGYALEIELESGERLLDLAAGDTAAIDVGVQANHVLIKPRHAVAGMNLTLLTDRRVYRFDYRAARSTGEPALQSVAYAVRFTFAAPVPATPVAAAPAPRNTEYWYCGAPALRPVAAYDDDVHTHLRFSARSELPAAFVREDDDTESLVNAHVEGDWLVLHRVARRWVLRLGRLVGCVDNRGFSGPSARSERGAAGTNLVRELRPVP